MGRGGLQVTYMHSMYVACYIDKRNNMYLTDVRQRMYHNFVSMFSYAKQTDIIGNTDGIVVIFDLTIVAWYHVNLCLHCHSLAFNLVSHCLD